MKPLTILFCVIACATQLAAAATFNFDEIVGDQRALMLLNFAKACFAKIDDRYELFSGIDYCVGEGGHFYQYLDEPTNILAERCARLNVVKYYFQGPENGGSYVTFKKSYSSLDSDTIVDSRAACAGLAQVFAAMPFNVYENTTKDCRKTLGIKENCVILQRTPTGVVAGFFYLVRANEVSSQCESLKAAQNQPPNMICTWSQARVGPDLRFRSTTELSKCPPLVPVANPDSCHK